jgi:hypothetical protein
MSTERSPLQGVAALAAAGLVNVKYVGADGTVTPISRAQAQRVLKRLITPRVAMRPAARARAVARPREHRSGRQGLRRGPPSDDPDPEPSALNRAWGSALEELSSPEEFETLGEYARIRSVWLGRWAA